MAVDIFDDRRCVIGEGPHFDSRTGRVVWVDILGGNILWRRATAASVGDAGVWAAGAAIGAAVPSTGGGLVLCLPDELVLLDGAGARRRVATYPYRTAQRPDLRSNDAKADPAGRLWHGTMTYDSRPGAGALYRTVPGSPAPEVIIEGTTVSNGLGWSPEGTTMYYVDSPTGRVDAFDFDPATGVPTNRRPFATVTDGSDPGVVPDGLCVDADGGIWVAVWGGAQVRRYTPEGRLDRTVGLPTPLVTSCAFAGADLDVLIITTASEGRPDDPAAGMTYLHRPAGVTGMECDRYRE
jgi:sugar lactone lactonase YvrE